MRTVRVMDGFYEAGSKFAIDRDFAGDVINASAQLVGQYTGPIAVNAVRGLRIPLGEDRRLSLGMLRLPAGAPHTMTVTKRLLEYPDDRSPAQRNGGLNGGKVYGSRVASSEVLLSVGGSGEPHTSMAQVAAVHELGHSFNLDHCATPGCVMLADNVVDRTTGRAALYASVALGRPFCDPCGEQLELAGYQALGAQL
jgi:hypothetical protein